MTLNYEFTSQKWKKNIYIYIRLDSLNVARLNGGVCICFPPPLCLFSSDLLLPHASAQRPRLSLNRLHVGEDLFVYIHAVLRVVLRGGGEIGLLLERAVHAVLLDHHVLAFAE